MTYGKFVDAEGSLAFELSFLSKAVGDDETSHMRGYILIEQSDKGEGLLGVATDGRRLHLVDPLDKAAAEAFGMAPGYWKIFKGGGRSRIWIARLDDSQIEETHLAWRNVIPKGEATYKTTFEGFSLTGPKGKHRNYGGLAKFIRDFPETTALDLDYIQCLGTGFTWNVEWYGPMEPLKFTEGRRLALIQPMRLY